MLEQTLARANRWALENIDTPWVDYVVSNTMTDVNRRVNGFLWTYALKAQVIKVLDEAPGVKTYILRPNQHWRGMRPGQHVELTLVIDGQPVSRRYSPTALPNGRLSITVKAQPEGRVSTWMHQHLRAGMVVKLGHPQGHFCHDGQDGAQGKVLFLTAGSGITPCHAMVNQWLAQPLAQRPDIQVIAQFRQAADVIFKSALQRWTQHGVRVSTALSQAGTSLPAGSIARLDLGQLQAQCPDLRDRDIYLCGPTGFMQAMLEHLQALGVDPARVHTERFTVAAAAPASAEGFEVAGAEVFFQHLNQRITLTAQDQGKTLLQVALDHGVPVESGCCQGMCGTCRLTVHEGQASGNVLGKVVYLCTAYPAASELVLDA